MWKIGTALEEQLLGTIGHVLVTIEDHNEFSKIPLQSLLFLLEECDEVDINIAHVFVGFLSYWWVPPPLICMSVICPHVSHFNGFFLHQDPLLFQPSKFNTCAHAFQASSDTNRSKLDKHLIMWSTQSTGPMY